MAVTLADIAQINNAGDSRALTLRGRLQAHSMLQYHKTSVTEGRGFSSDNVTGFGSKRKLIFDLASSSYFTPGAGLSGSDRNFNQRVINVDKDNVSHCYIDRKESMLMGEDTLMPIMTTQTRRIARDAGIVRLRVGLKAAFSTTRNVGTTYPLESGKVVNYDSSLTGNSAKIYAAVKTAAQLMDDMEVPDDQRFLFIKTSTYYELADSEKAMNQDWSGVGSVATGMLPMSWGFHVVKTPWLPTDNFTGTTNVHVGGTAGTNGNDYTNDNRNVVAVALHASCMGDVFNGGQMETTLDMIPEERAWLMTASKQMGCNYFQPAGGVVIRTAAP